MNKVLLTMLGVLGGSALLVGSFVLGKGLGIITCMAAGVNAGNDPALYRFKKREILVTKNPITGEVDFIENEIES